MQKIFHYGLYLFLVYTCLNFSAAAIGSAMPSNAEEKENGEMMIYNESKGRATASEQKHKELPGNIKSSLSETDPDFSKTMDRFMFGDIYQQGNLNDKQRELISLTVLAAIQSEEQLKLHTIAALNAGAAPVEVKESIYQCAPYIGFPKASAALTQVNRVLKQQGISLPLESQTRVTEKTRFNEGLKVQKQIFGDVIDQAHANAP